MQVRFFHNACYNSIFDEMWLIRVEYINEMGLNSIVIIASSKILIFFTRRENSLRENKSKYDESRDSEVVYIECSRADVLSIRHTTSSRLIKVTGGKFTVRDSIKKGMKK